jgi:glycosyltransferase involved in cell wall biosynthesis
MKIIIPILGSFGKAGGWRVLSQLANYWIKSGNEVSFLVHCSSPEPYFPTNASIIYYDNKGKIVSDSTPYYSKPFGGIIKLRKALELALNKLNASIVLANHSLSAGPVSKSTIQAKKFYYVQAYEPEYYSKPGFKNLIFRYLSKKSYTLGLDIIVNSPMYLDYKEIKSNKVVYPGIDLDIFRPNNEVKKETTKYVIGTIGREEKVKGTRDILEAFKILRQKYSTQVELHVAFGKMGNDIDGVINVDINGDMELAEFYNKIDVYVCAGLVQLKAVHYPVIESMACKTPVITTGYLPANNMNAKLVSINSPLSIMTALTELIEKNDFQEKVEQGIKDIQVFKWSIVSEKMLNYFNGI